MAFTGERECELEEDSPHWSEHHGLFCRRSHIVTEPVESADAMMWDTSGFHARDVMEELDCVSGVMLSDGIVTVGWSGVSRDEIRISPRDDPVARRLAESGWGLNCSAEIAPLLCLSMVDNRALSLLSLLSAPLPLYELTMSRGFQM